MNAEADAAILAAAEEAAHGHPSAAALAVEAVPEDISLAAAAACAFNEGGAGERVGRKQQGPQRKAWKLRPGAKSGLRYFIHTSHPFTAGGAAMQFLRDKISDREDLLKLIEGWSAYREESSGNHFYRVPDEQGDIRSAVNAVNYLKDLARLNAGEQLLKGEHPAHISDRIIPYWSSPSMKHGCGRKPHLRRPLSCIWFDCRLTRAQTTHTAQISVSGCGCAMASE